MEPRERRGEEETIAPHPTLDRYYDDEQGRRAFVREIFDTTAPDYDRVERMMALGTGSWYRRRALRRWGLGPGARVLDVATGTGLVAREAIALTGKSGSVIGLDPSTGMLSEARRALSLDAVLSVGEQLPIGDESVDFLTLGYALRHLSDLAATFREFRRVLRPGGRVCILEMTPPRSGLGKVLLRFYVRGLTPALARLTGRRVETARLWEYFWDTMEACVPPEDVLAALRAAGFRKTERYVEILIFSEYAAVK